MYPQCRYLRPGGQSCRAAALKGSQWCYYHGRLHQRYRAQKARRRLHNQRDASGRFTPAHHHCMEPRPGQPSRPHPAPADPNMAAGEASEAANPNFPAPSSFFPHGEAVMFSSHTERSSHPQRREAPAAHPPLTLPPIEDSASVQLALTGVLQALAANQLDVKRAGLLLHGLQVASTHVQHTHAKPADTK